MFVYEVTVEDTITPEGDAVVEETWRRNGVVERYGHPAIIRYDKETGRLHSETWMMGGKEDRDDGPSTTIYSTPGSPYPKYERWCTDGEPCNLDGPAIRVWYPNGKIAQESFFVGGEPNRAYRLYDPAHIEYHENGRLKVEAYFLNGGPANVDGVARVHYDEHENIILAERCDQFGQLSPIVEDGPSPV